MADPIAPTAIYSASSLPVQQYAAHLAVQQSVLPSVQSVLLPDGRVVTGYAMSQQPPAETSSMKVGVSPLAANIALGGIGFAAICGGLLLLTNFIVALTALLTQLIILVAVIFGGFIAVQVFAASSSSKGSSTTVNIKKAVFRRNNFKG